MQRCDICSSVKTLIFYGFFNGFQMIPYSSTQAHRRHGGHRPNQCLAESLFFHWFLKVFERYVTDSGSALFRMRASLDSTVATLQKRLFYKGFLKACGGFHGRHGPPGWGLSLCCLAKSLFFHWFLKVFRDMLPILGHPFGPPSRKHKVFQCFLKDLQGQPAGLPDRIQVYVKA